MKRCPECRRDYIDDSLSFCLEDGVALVQGPVSVDEPATAILGSGPQLEAEPPTVFTDSPERQSLSAHRAAERQEISHESSERQSFSEGQTAVPKRSGVSYRRLLLIPIAIAVIVFAIFFGYRYFKSTSPINSIAILPLENRGSADSDYLSDGVAESLIYKLSQLPNLKVSPRSSVFRYKGKELDVEKIGAELDVDAVMSGRITQRGDNLSISVDLVDVRNNKSLWGEQYDRKISDLLVTQREIASEIATKLQLRLSGDGERALEKRYTDNNDAYQLYLKGRFHFAKRNRADLDRSVGYFKQSIDTDKNFALAYSALADTYNAMTAYPYMAPKDAVPLAKAAASRALEIDPELAEAHTALANTMACFDWNWDGAEQEFKRAIEIKQNDAGTHWRYAMFHLMLVGRFDEAIAEGERSLELEPLDLNHGANLSGIYFYARQDDKAIAKAEEVYGLDPNFIVGRWALSQAYIQKGRYAEVIDLNERALRTDPTNPVFLRFAGIAYAKAGRRQDAERIIQTFKEISKTQYVMAYHLALIYSALGDKDRAFAELENAIAEHDYLLPRIKVEPFLDPLRDDPRMGEMIRRLNLPK